MGWFDDDYQLNTTNYVLYVLLPNGQDVVKFWPQNYYSETGGGGHVQLRYQIGLTYQQECNQVLGDVNNDSSIDILDITSMVEYVIGIHDFNNMQLCVGDLNYSSILNVTDIIILVDYILGN